MPDVSILIPAYRPDFFDACVASALAQTHRDFELIVSDDCPTDDIGKLLAKWNDPRIRYVRNPTPRRGATNRDNLLRLARGKYLKFLFDDDLLYPSSVEKLLHAAHATGAKLVFHHRHFIDSVGRILLAPTVVPAGAISRLMPEAIYEEIIGRISNPIGEPTNMLIDADALRAIDLPFGTLGRSFRFLTDVALMYNFARVGLGIVGVGFFGSAFRQHTNQNSNERSPQFAAGYFEWEVLARSAKAAQLLSAHAYLESLRRVHEQYRRYEAQQPVFARFLALEPFDSAGECLNARFLQTLDLAYLDIDLRLFGPIREPTAAEGQAARVTVQELRHPASTLP
jgi:glycosyltransferase involved in cell wall biosynthesis